MGINKYFVTILSLFLLATTVIGCSNAEINYNKAQFSESDYNLKVGEELELRFIANVKQGDHWQPLYYDNSIIELTNYQVLSQTAEGSVGPETVDGSNIFVFKALRPGATEIRMVYVPYWFIGVPDPENMGLNTYLYYVTVED